MLRYDNILNGMTIIPVTTTLSPKSYRNVQKHQHQQQQCTGVTMFTFSMRSSISVVLIAFQERSFSSSSLSGTHDATSLSSDRTVFVSYSGNK